MTHHVAICSVYFIPSVRRSCWSWGSWWRRAGGWRSTGGLVWGSCATSCHHSCSIGHAIATSVSLEPQCPTSKELGSPDDQGEWNMEKWVTRISTVVLEKGHSDSMLNEQAIAKQVGNPCLAVNPSSSGLACSIAWQGPDNDCLSTSWNTII